MSALRARDKEYVENRLASSAAEAVAAIERLKARGRTADADELMRELKRFQDVCRLVRSRI